MAKYFWCLSENSLETEPTLPPWGGQRRVNVPRYEFPGAHRSGEDLLIRKFRLNGPFPRTQTEDSAPTCVENMDAKAKNDRRYMAKSPWLLQNNLCALYNPSVRIP